MKLDVGTMSQVSHFYEFLKNKATFELQYLLKHAWTILNVSFTNIYIKLNVETNLVFTFNLSFLIMQVILFDHKIQLLNVLQVRFR